MATYHGRRDFRTGRGTVILSIVVAAVFATGTAMTYRERGWTWVSIALGCGTIVAVAGVVESLVRRVRLTDDGVVVTDLRGHRRYPATDIVGVEEAKGTPTTLTLTDGRCVPLPPVGSSLGNSIRAWLKSSDDRKH